MPDGTVPRELNPGDRIGRYTIVRPLGRGGMGVVYVARDERLGRDVALKMIAGLPDDTARSRFWREARAAASVNHPHICQVFEVDESPEGTFLTMELLEGEALDRRLVRGALPPQDAVPIALGMLGALGALHMRGLVHRDVKPSNVFVTPHGPKLLDFGLARPALSGALHFDPSAATPVTDAGMIVGTPQYMAPEQVTGAALDGRTDLYAVGAVIFQMLAGRPPLTGSGPDILFAALKENPPALQGPPAVVAIDRVIRRAMRKDSNERYSTAEQMAADLAAVALSGSAPGFAVPVRALTRIVVPPLRIAPNDSAVAFLSFGLAEAVSGSLAALGDVVVRAPAVAAKWSEDGSDPRRLAAEADVASTTKTATTTTGSPRRRSGRRWSSHPTCRSRIDTSRTSSRSTVKRPPRSAACCGTPVAIATTRSCSRASSTPAATPACSTRRSRHTKKPCGSIPTWPPAWNTRSPTCRTAPRRPRPSPRRAPERSTAFFLRSLSVIPPRRAPCSARSAST